LGISPQSLRRNKFGPSQPWKQPVKDWIGELYEKRFGRKKGTNDSASRSGLRPPTKSNYCR
jgi:hypothetical protein